METWRHMAGANRFAMTTGSDKVAPLEERRRIIDPVVEAYMADVDRTLLRENLELTPGQRLEKFVRFAAFADELAQAGRRC